MRIMGKRQIGELQPYELVITIIISELASIPISDTDVYKRQALYSLIVLIAKVEVSKVTIIISTILYLLFSYLMVSKIKLTKV